MRVVIAHNEYQQRGGEDAVVEAEAALLRQHGHQVLDYRRHNDEIGTLGKATLARQTMWSDRTAEDVSALITQFKPDVIHVHNTLPLISPSIYWAADRSKVPVVQTLHNFRIICPQALLLRDGKVCEDCVGKLPWRGAVRKCYRGSLAQSSIVASAITFHRGLGTWNRKISRYIALNDFCRNKFIEGGLPADKIVVKPNFVDMPDAPLHNERRGFLYVGRLSVEKGIAVLAHAVKKAPEVSLKVAGSGPEEVEFDGAPGVQLLGAMPPDAVYQQMRNATALVMPSVWYENFPRTLVEAFACGLPVIASRIGALAHLVDDESTGLLFEPGNPADLADKLRWANAHPQRMAEMGLRARAKYEAELTGDVNYRMLIDIYAAAAEQRSQAS